jgi:hypothetical protein
MSGPDWWVCDKHKTSGIMEPGSYCKDCSDEHKALKKSLEDASKLYRDQWAALDGIMVEAGMDAKATPEEARRWLRDELHKVGILKSLLREIQWGPAPEMPTNDCPYCLKEQRDGHSENCAIAAQLGDGC